PGARCGRRSRGAARGTAVTRPAARRRSGRRGARRPSSGWSGRTGSPPGRALVAVDGRPHAADELARRAADLLPAPRRLLVVESDLTVVVSGHRAPPPRVLGAAAIAETHGTATTLASSRKACAQRLGKLERSSRSRGLLYLAAAVHAAAAHGVRRVDVPENGQLAVNPPLTPSRLGALSTRSVHPWTLHQLNELIDAVGGDVVVYNP